MADLNILDKIRSDTDELPTTREDSKTEYQDALEDEFTKVGEPHILITDIRQKFEESKMFRQVYEHQWIKNVMAFRGKDHGPQMRESEKAKPYVRTTTVKVKAAYAQIIESLLSDSKFPISISETEVPNGVSQWAHLKTDMEENVALPEEEDEGPTLLGGVGFAGDGLELEPGSKMGDVKFLGGLGEKYTKEDGTTILEEGVARDGSIQISPAKEIARRIEKSIHDRLDETQGHTELRKKIFEMCLLGSGVMKGPFNITKTSHRWDKDGKYVPETSRSCRSNMVSLWNAYPDPTATRAEEMEWFIERHKMTRTQLKQLKTRPHFDGKEIDRLSREKGNYVYEHFEHTLDQSSHTSHEDRLYEVLEYWGTVDVECLSEFGITAPEHSVDGQMVQINAWISGDKVLRAVVNPFTPQRIPYYITPYETDPYSIFGTGVPETMEDTQALMNGFMRLAVDNLALSGNLVFEIDEASLAPGQDRDIYPGRVFERQSGGMGQAIHAIDFPNTAPANMEMFRQARQLADESTGIPSFAHGQTGVMSPTRTASGMSMLLSNASLNIKTVVRNIDDYLLKPWGEAYFRWEMQYNPDPELRGDLEVKAMGSSSMQMKEVRSNRMNTFLQLASNPAIAPLIKIPTIVRELAISLEMDPDEILNNPEEQELYAELMGKQQMPPQQAMGNAPAAPGTAMPGDPSYTGNNEGMGNTGGQEDPSMMV